MRGLTFSPTASQMALPNARALDPVVVSLVVGVGHLAPMGEVVAVDHADRAVVQAELPLRRVGDDGDRLPAGLAGDLQGHAAQPAGRAPDQNHVALLHHVRRPAHQHAIGRRRAEEIGGRRFPGQPRRLGNALMRLRAGELAIAAVVGLVAPDAGAFRQHRVAPRQHPGIVRLPPAAVDHHLVARLDRFHVLADRPDDPGAVAAAGVEVFLLAQRLLAFPDNIDRPAQRRPYVVVIDAGRHHVDEDLVVADLRGGKNLALPGGPRRAESILPHGERMHARRHLPERRTLTEVVQIQADLPTD